MKKNLFLLGLAVAAMTSCTNDEVVEMKQPTQKAIGFESFVNKTTRAITETNGSLAKFYVNGYYGNNVEVFGQEEVTKSGNVWSYGDDKKYWTANTYYFAAYAQGNDNVAPNNVEFKKPANGNHGTLTISDYEVGYTPSSESSATICNAMDLVADIVQEQGTQGRGDDVDFTLKHLLSKVKFTIKNTDSKFPMTISDLTISGVVKKGTFTSSYSATWQPTQSNWDMSDETADKITITPIKEQSGIVAQTGQVASAEFLVLPQDLTNVKFSIKADYYDGDDLVYTKNFVLSPVKTNTYSAWAPNTYYEYTISLPTSAQPIEFGTVGVNGWGNTIEIELNSGDTGTNGARQ